MTKISKSHDRFFRAALSQPEVAQGLLSQHLSKKMLEQVDLTTLQLCKENFVEPDLSEVITDVLFRVKINQQAGYCYLLAEHQSKPDKLMPYRLLRYMVNIMKYHLDNNTSKVENLLPAIIPIVFFNGQEDWRYSKNLFDLFGAQKKLMQEILLNDFQLVDFKQIPDDKLRTESWSSLLTLMSKYIFSRDLLSILETLRDQIQFVEQNQGGDYLRSMLKYILVKGEIADKRAFLSFLGSAVSKETGAEVMSLAEQWQTEGEQRGLVKGEQRGLVKGEQRGLVKGEQRGLVKGEQRGLVKGEQRGLAKGKIEGERSAKLAIARNLLAEGMGIDLVVKATRLPRDQIEQLKNESL